MQYLINLYVLFSQTEYMREEIVVLLAAVFISFFVQIALEVCETIFYVSVTI